MKVTMLFRLLMLIFLSLLIEVYARGSSGGSVHVNGYYRSNGTYVAPHYRSAPDGDFSNNWSTKGNINPYTGEEGTKIDPNTGSSKGEGSTNAVSTTVVNPEPNTGSEVNSASSVTSYSAGTGTAENKVSKVITKKSSIPEHGKLNYFGNGWECERGYYQSGNGCIEVEIPINGKLDYLGHEWECQRGFYRLRNTCEAINIPEHGKLDYLGHEWTCDRGYERSGNQCTKL